MGKLKVLSGKDLCRILEIFDFECIRQKGSHIIMQKKINDTTITIPIPDHKELKQGTLKSIIRKSNIDLQVFLTK